MSQSAASNQQLQDAFALFNQVSEQLTGSYQALQQQVTSLTQELGVARTERSRLLDEMRMLQDEVAHSRRLSSMGQMTARLAHQIRTPLSTALLYASQLNSAELPRQQHNCFVERLLTGLRHLDHMVNDMLVFARDNRSCDEESIFLPDVLEQVRQFLLPQLETQKAVWTVNSNGEIPPTCGQREVLASVFSNLASNALHAAGDGVQLDWTVEANPSELRLVLEDNGPGVAESLQAQIFDPFFTTRANGTGLGLAVVRAVITAHHGTVELDPSYTNGARFVVCLPVQQHEQQLPSAMMKKQKKAGTACSRCE
ncbi:two-component system sensor histidine kinase FlrB [Thiogranum longum]|uniref:histidine kinase n=1 Tax=Thiogranum longum TaxID=1537524 RepID=A0A4R1HHH5_9GAMM|nr:HAMP domain-containing sensor histidine kinase [Thiogranum longum]TCK18849.1 two-component system sensor histidine kinase FlrB [Thiogranum longum]